MSKFNGRVEFKLPSLPPSMNTLYKINYAKRQVYMSMDARIYKSQMKVFVPPVELEGQERLAIRFWLFGNWYFKNGRVKKIDASNLEKLLCDLVSEKMGFDDCLFFDKRVTKVQSTESFVKVKVGYFEQELDKEVGSVVVDEKSNGRNEKGA